MRGEHGWKDSGLYETAVEFVLTDRRSAFIADEYRGAHRFVGDAFDVDSGGEHDRRRNRCGSDLPGVRVDVDREREHSPAVIRDGVVLIPSGPGETAELDGPDTAGSEGVDRLPGLGDRPRLRRGAGRQRPQQNDRNSSDLVHEGL